MNIDGSCHCGFIRYEADVDADRVIICHCTDCQTLSGSAFRVVVQTLPGTFRLVSGEPRIYRKKSDSGAIREQGFCPECGTPIFSRPLGDGERALGLRVGTITQRRKLVPKAQYWSRSSQGWLCELADIREWETQPDFHADGTFET